MSGAEQDLLGAWVEVLVDCPGAKGLYTYGVSRELAVTPGNIVSVSFGAQQVCAIAIRLISKPPEGLEPSSIKSIESIINTTFFNKEYWQLLNRVARYYQTPLIKVVRTTLPPGLLSRSQRRIRLNKHVSVETIERLTNSLGVSRSAAQLIATLRNSPQGDYSWQYLQRQLPTTAAQQALYQLTELGLVESYLASPRAPRAQKRQAVLLIQSARVPAAVDGAASAPAKPSGEAASSELSARQREILMSLERHGGELWLSDALQLLSTTSKTLKKLADQGYLAIEPQEVLRLGDHTSAQPDRPKALTADQSKALETLLAMRGYDEALLHGVTGSGKTEVYLQAIAPILNAQKSALVLVPEIGLTPQLTDRFRSRFGDQVCVYHSGLSEGERYDTWRQMLAGTPQVVIGTRSAVFAPLPHLGMIILDEEHDSSFKQDRPMPCYHARQVARWRAELEECPLILGSATPAIETWVRFKEKPHYLSLPQRVHARPLPTAEIVDMREELHQGNRTIFSRALQQALEDLLEAGNQGILFIHRRGHSSFVSCRSCGYVMECPHCDVSLSFHQPHQNAGASLRCHYCGYAQSHPPQCPDCASPYLKNFGSGTQRVVNDLARYLPQARCIRFDSDTTRNKGAHRALLTRFGQGEADLLVGTQMLTKGIDLPQVTLVGVIAADGLLFMPDYRASERAFQTMTQVAGRAGRGEQPGRVIVQTYSPDHVAIKALMSPEQTGLSETSADVPGGYEAFLTAELSDRAALEYPPYGQLVLLRLSGLDARVTEMAAERMAASLTDHLSNWDSGLYEMMGPVPAPVFRVARRYRWHILLKLSLDADIPDLTQLRSACPKGVSLTIDVDPLNLS
ncbi:primosomal protein N' [Leptolyngbya sp. BC1307]|uniref:primosomal protein N' n=1 Tax=Leptolyngbya sp. BC1307 TaxID=2029589 RepID=UPI000EFB77D0|nr:primosomal protein N' [Leptolyngbya sp. BC1307]